MKTTCKAFAAAVLYWQTGGAQTPASIIQIETDNNVRYIFETPNFSEFGANPNATNVTFPTFATWVTEADIVSVNGKPAKGVYLTRQTAINLTPTAVPGQGISDVTATNIVDRILVLMQPDSTPIGSIMMLGLDGGAPPPGSLATARQGNFAIAGGTGAFLGLRGQFVSGPTIPGAIATRSGSVKEDPARRRINGGGRAIFLLHLIPMMRPEVIITGDGPAVFHADFSPVTTARPAKAGELLIVRATGLGPTIPGVDPGQPFPTDGVQQVNSPVEVSLNGESGEVVNKIGWPGQLDAYRVDFRVPAKVSPGNAKLQLSAAWINGTPVEIPVQ